MSERFPPGDFLVSFLANGIEGVRLINEYDPEAKVIMCTAVGDKTAVIEAIKLGAKDYIKKPFDEKRVLDSIKRILKES